MHIMTVFFLLFSSSGFSYADDWNCGLFFCYESNRQCKETAEKIINQPNVINITAYRCLLTFTCKQGYELIGTQFIFCDTYNKKLLSKEFPKCRPLPTDLGNTTIDTNNTCNNTTMGSMIGHSISSFVTQTMLSNTREHEIEHMHFGLHEKDFLIIGLLLFVAILLAIVSAISVYSWHLRRALMKERLSKSDDFQLEPRNVKTQEKDYVSLHRRNSHDFAMSEPTLNVIQPEPQRQRLRTPESENCENVYDYPTVESLREQMMDSQQKVIDQSQQKLDTLNLSDDDDCTVVNNTYYVS